MTTRRMSPAKRAAVARAGSGLTTTTLRPRVASRWTASGTSATRRSSAACSATTPIVRGVMHPSSPRSVGTSSALAPALARTFRHGTRSIADVPGPDRCWPVTCSAIPGTGEKNHGRNPASPHHLPAPGSPDSPIEVAAQYGNFIGGAWVAPVDGKYRENLHARHGRGDLRGRRLHARRHRARARRRPRGQGCLGRARRPPSGRPCSTRSPT